jgi:hypothetical protein
MIPFKVPDDLLAELAGGTLRRIGATLRNPKGRIVAHLQETGLLQEAAQAAISSGGSRIGLLLSAARLGSSVWANVQLEQVKSMLSRLSMLNAATLAASVVGVGVSAAGFALVLQRLRQLERSIAGVHEDVKAGRLAAERVDIQFTTGSRARLESLLYLAEEAWVRSDAAEVWRELASHLDPAQRYWRGLVSGLTAPSIFIDSHFSLEEAAVAYEAALALAAARVQALLLIEQHAAAVCQAREFSCWHEAVVTRITSIDIAEARWRGLAQSEGLSEQDARARLHRRSEPFLAGLLEVHRHIAHRPLLLQALVARGLNGREYVEAVQRSGGVPLLALPVP